MNTALNILSAVFERAVELRRLAYRRGWLQTRRLNQPVVSIGNLSVGGTGKTPLVAMMARTLIAAGHRPCILTRGYKRRAGRSLVVLEPGAAHPADPREVGDEPAELARALPDVPIIVSAERWRAGLLGERRFQASVYLLDDGFQHLALRRDLDVVLLDVSSPASAFAPLPAGRLREAVSALGRAHWIILTRTELADAGGWQARVEAANPRAHIFHCSTRLAGLLEARRSAPVPAEDLRGRKVAAFCGIGNPAAFFADLRNWGFGVVAENAFPDHHAYRGEDLSRIAALAQSAGAEAILTTQKDLLNLPPRWDFPLPLFACCIQPEIEEKIEFERGLLTAVEAARRATG